MKKYIFCFLIFSVVSAYGATSYNFTKPANLTRLREELIADGADVVHGPECRDGQCTVFFGPGGEGIDKVAVLSAHVYIDYDAVRITLDSNIASLASKLRSKTITTAERDELLDKMLQHMGF